jgi:hypothetical protein
MPGQKEQLINLIMEFCEKKLMIRTFSEYQFYDNINKRVCISNFKLTQYAIKCFLTNESFNIESAQKGLLVSQLWIGDYSKAASFHTLFSWIRAITKNYLKTWENKNITNATIINDIFNIEYAEFINEMFTAKHTIKNDCSSDDKIIEKLKEEIQTKIKKEKDDNNTLMEANNITSRITEQYKTKYESVMRLADDTMKENNTTSLVHSTLHFEKNLQKTAQAFIEKYIIMLLKKKFEALKSEIENSGKPKDEYIKNILEYYIEEITEYKKKCRKKPCTHNNQKKNTSIDEKNAIEATLKNIKTLDTNYTSLVKPNAQDPLKNEETQNLPEKKSNETSEKSIMEKFITLYKQQNQDINPYLDPNNYIYECAQQIDGLLSKEYKYLWLSTILGDEVKDLSYDDLTKMIQDRINKIKDELNLMICYGISGTGKTQVTMRYIYEYICRIKQFIITDEGKKWSHYVYDFQKDTLVNQANSSDTIVQDITT